MNGISRSLVARLVILCGLVSPAAAQTIKYTISLSNPSEHLISIKIVLPPGAAERILQLPVWYGLYQVRDFAQYVRSIRAENSVQIREIDASKWRITGAESGATIQYEIFANEPGPFGAQLNSHHAFLNLAEVLMYPDNARNSPSFLRFTNVAEGWKIGTSLRSFGDGFTGNNYDELADSPVEIASYDERDFDEGGGHYRVIVDGVPGDYDFSKLVSVVRGIVSAEVSWMGELPFNTYLFIYHFPRESGGGGMEHANGTAIDLDSHTLATTPHAIDGVTAHEFFHLWNVKRIRPQSLEPIDYSKENYTDALWFSEGLTSTVEEYALLRAGLLNEPDFYAHLAGAIAELKNRPAHLTQSAEESSLDAWLEKYAYYRTPSRSISYYNKGELLGVLIDLRLRDASGGRQSLRDLFRFMSQTYARAGKFFPDSDGVRRALEFIAPSDWKSFFDKYVAGTEEIPWNDFLSSVGLRLTSEPVETADAGFTAARNFDSPLVVTSVAGDGNAGRAGLAVGDIILKINGHAPKDSFDENVKALHGGDKIKLKVSNQNGEHELSWTIGMHRGVNFIISDLASLTPQQKTRREAWLQGESEPLTTAHP